MRLKRLITACAISSLSLIAIASCGGNENKSEQESIIASESEKTSEVVSVDEKLDYTITVKAFNGKPISDVLVDVYDEDENFLNIFEGTDENGQVTFNLDAGRYFFRVTSVDGFPIEEEFYESDSVGTPIEITTDVEIRKTPLPATYRYSQGDVMYDFDLVTTKGENLNLVNLLEDNQLVVLNFFYCNCYYCNEEFPYLEEAYEQYKDKGVEVITIDSGIDTVEQIDSFMATSGLTFKSVASSVELLSSFNVVGFPTTVFIDKYGLIGSIDEGSVASTDAWTLEFDKYLTPDYVPVYDDGSNPTIKIPDISQPDSAVLEAVANNTQSGFNGTYHPEQDSDDAKYSWPWIVSEDGQYIQPSNAGLDGSFSTVYTQAKLKKDQVLAFDYITSCEEYDVLYVLVNRDILATICGVDRRKQTCYLYVAPEDDTYEIAFCFYKDGIESAGDDTVYVNNIRICDIDDIDQPTYVFRQASTGTYSQFTHEFKRYADVVYNEEDDYYHVRTKDGPILLADLQNTTHFDNYDSVYNWGYYGWTDDIDGVNYTDIINKYVTYQSNSKIGYVPVTKELQNALYHVTQALLGKVTETAWLQVCMYFDAYGTNGVELEDPCVGLNTDKPYIATLGQNYAVFTNIVFPRGYIFKFVPEQDGVYCVNTQTEYGTVMWWVRSNGAMTEYDSDARYYATEAGMNDHNVKAYQYMEANKPYYFCIAFDDIYQMGSLPFTVSYVGSSYSYLTLASPTYFTSLVDDNGEMTGHVVSNDKIRVGLDTDGYYKVLNKDGSLSDQFVYADFMYPTILDCGLKDAIDRNAFNFRYDEMGYELDEGVDYTEKAREYAALMETDPTSDYYGLVKVDEELAKMLKMIMNKYQFTHSEEEEAYEQAHGMECTILYDWLKLCYYEIILG